MRIAKTENSSISRDMIISAKYDAVRSGKDGLKNGLPTSKGVHLSTVSNNDDFLQCNEDMLQRGQIRIDPDVMTGRTAQLVAKRAIDFVFSAAALIALAPALLLIALVIRLESPGTALFRQSRTGQDGKLFTIYKFRTMRSDLCDATGVQQTETGDNRFTRLGRFLRKTNIDELPQLLNVLFGNMSIVGPRPHVPGMLAAGVLYEELVPGYEYRHLMKPGLTGLAQARGLRGPTDDYWKSKRRVICDVEYIRRFSLLLDAKIVLRTISAELKGGTGL